jgi:serine phosphatase RsbU (regulator of sigma subunit)/CHASE3 domain sensor protein
MLPAVMRLPRRVQLLIAGFVALVTFALGINVAGLRMRERASDRLLDRLEPAQLELQSLLTALVDQETGERGFLLTGKDAFLEPYVTGRAETARALEHLGSLLASDSDLVSGVQRVRSRVHAWQQLGADFEIAAERGGREQVVSALVTAGTGTRLFDSLRAEIADLEGKLRAATAADEADVERLDRDLVLIDLGTLVLALALLAAGAALARVWFTRPLAGLARSVQEVSGGSLRSTVTADGPPEFAELAADVDAMRRRILAEVEEAERAREALAERGMVVLTLRDELAAAAPDLPEGVRLAGRFAPALGIVAGDWFDVLRLPGDRLAVALVDVSGHGAGVGAFALRTKALTVAAMQTLEPGDALGWVADRLGDTDEQFLTGVIFVLDPASGVVRYASAGHPPLLLGGLTGIVELGATGPLLGPVAGRWSTDEVELTRGGVLVAFSDGVIEARSDDGEPFGVGRLREIVEHHQIEGPDAVADACLDAVQQHQSTREDDLTLVVLSR